MAVQQECAVGIVNCIKTLWEQDGLLDHEVKVEDETFKCHRVILAACSFFFKNSFIQQQGKDIEKVSTLQNMSSATFKLILTAIYTGHDVLTDENTIDVWKASHFLQIDFLIKHCENKIVQGLTLGNLTDMQKLAKCLDSKTVSHGIANFIARRFDEFKDLEMFCQLSSDEIMMAVESHDLVTSNEENVIFAILKWVDYNKDDSDKLKMLAPLLKAARLCLLSHPFYQTILQDELIKADEMARNVIFEAQYQKTLNGDGQWLQCPKTAVYRANSENDHYGVIVKNNGRVEAFSLTKMKWFKLSLTKKAIFQPNFYFSIQVFKKEIYATCYNKFSIAIHIYKFKEHQWKKVCHVINIKIQQYYILNYEDYLYILSVKEKKLFKYNPSASEFPSEEFTQLPKNVSYDQITYAITYKTHICVFLKKMNSLLTGVYSLDLNKKEIEWTNIGELPGSENGLTHFNHNNATFILLSNGALFEIVTAGPGSFEFKLIDQLWDFDARLHGAYMVSDNLIVFGEHPSENIEKLTLPSKIVGVITYRIINDGNSNIVPVVLSKNEVKPICNGSCTL